MRKVRLVLKRSDIKTGTLILRDLYPQTIRRPTPVVLDAQSVYQDGPSTEDAVSREDSGVTTVLEDVTGLAAYFLANVDDGTGVAATGGLNINSSVPAGTEINLGGTIFTGVVGARTSGENDFSVDGTQENVASDLTDAFNDPLNGPALNSAVEATASVVGTQITVTADNVGTDGNSIPIGAGTLTGGVDATAMTFEQANLSKDNVLNNLVKIDDTSSASSALTLANVDGELVVGSLTVEQHEDVLDILSGRQYVLTKGTQIDMNGTVTITGDYGFRGVLKAIYDTGEFKVSYQGGDLSRFRRSSFKFGSLTGTNLEAVSVFDADGEIYSP